MRRSIAASVLAIAVLPFVSGNAYSDCGSVPFLSPLEIARSMKITAGADGKNDVYFNPLDVVVFEPGQRAIILWNGDEEILLLSTEIKTSQPVSLLEVIPLPSEPTVKLGDFETFKAMQQLLIQKTMWRVASGGGVAGARPPEDAGEVTFHDKMGAHDIAVVHVLDEAGFVTWVEQFMYEKKALNPALDPEFKKVVGNYLNRGTRWFVFDSIEAQEEVQTKEPIEYRFKTDSLYYPLEISSRETGKSNIELLLVTPQRLEQYPDVRVAMKKDAPVEITNRQLEKASSDWPGFFPNSSVLAMQHIRIRGSMSKMTSDFIAR